MPPTVWLIPFFVPIFDFFTYQSKQSQGTVQQVQRYKKKGIWCKGGEGCQTKWWHMVRPPPSLLRYVIYGQPPEGNLMEMFDERFWASTRNSNTCQNIWIVLAQSALPASLEFLTLGSCQLSMLHLVLIPQLLGQSWQLQECASAKSSFLSLENQH